jgi:hypothetical protein
MTRAEAREANKLFSETDTPANIKPFATRGAWGLDLADRMWQAFETRRFGLP